MLQQQGSALGGDDYCRLGPGGWGNRVRDPVGRDHDEAEVCNWGIRLYVYVSRSHPAYILLVQQRDAVAAGSACLKTRQRQALNHLRGHLLGFVMHHSTGAYLIPSPKLARVGHSLSCFVSTLGLFDRRLLLCSARSTPHGIRFICSNAGHPRYGHVDAAFKENMTKEEAQQFVRKAISHAMARDGSSGGVIRMVVIDKTGVSVMPTLGCSRAVAHSPP